VERAKEPGDRAREARDGDRRDTPPREMFRSRRESRAGMRPAEPSPFLGVVTAPVPPALAAQLGLPEGFGLLVEEVLPESPAQAAGLKRFDVLKLLNEQQLISVEQLTTLVRSMGKEAEVKVTFLRGGQEQKASMKLAEKMLPPSLAGPENVLKHRLLEFGDIGRGAREAGEQHEQMRRFQQRMKNFKEEMERYQAQIREYQKAAGKQFPHPPTPPQLPIPQQPPLGDVFRSRENLLHELRPGGAAEVRIYQPDGRTTFQTNNARVKLNDDDGEFELATTDGKRTLTAKNRTGETVFTGPIDTPEQLARVPAPFASKIQFLADQKGLQLQGDRIEVNTAKAGSSSAPAPAPAPETPTAGDAEKERAVQ